MQALLALVALPLAAATLIALRRRALGRPFAPRLLPLAAPLTPGERENSSDYSSLVWYYGV